MSDLKKQFQARRKQLRKEEPSPSTLTTPQGALKLPKEILDPKEKLQEELKTNPSSPSELA